MEVQVLSSAPYKKDQILLVFFVSVGKKDLMKNEQTFGKSLLPAENKSSRPQIQLVHQTSLRCANR
ncbi:MAG TPA: hypothetical protein VJ843_03340 [Candidatus Saccharimonadales bacterium]|nr:hypothetical protein [Candidatus Saccharimonadales bacterium]